MAADFSNVAAARRGTDEPTFRRRTLRLALGTAWLVACGYLGQATVIEGQSLNLISPAIGVAGLWIASGNRRTWPTDLIALSASIVLVTMTTGADLSSAAVFLGTNVIQVFVFVVLTRLWVPHVWGLGGTEPLQRIGDLGRLALAASISGVAGLVVGFISAYVALGVVLEVPTLGVWWGRNSIALIVVTVLGVLIGQPFSRARTVRAAIRMVADALRPASPRRFAEVVLLLLLTVVICFVVFVDRSGQPLTFLLLVMSVWAGLRFGPVAVTVHGVLMGVCGIAFTLHGEGPFASVESIHYRALVAQLFVAMTVLTGLALAFSRVERDAANRELARARKAADDRAHLLDAVLESLKEGVVVIEEGGRLLVRNRAALELIGLEEPAQEHVRPAAEYGLFHGNGLPLLDAELPGSRALAGEVVAPHDVHVRAASLPQGRVLEMSAQPLADEDPTALRRAMVNLRDVTVDRQHRDTLASFAGVVAHDLSNPLTVIDGWAEALHEEFSIGPVSPVVGQLMVKRIQGSAAHMREFIADLMSYTIARDQSLRSGPVDVSALVRSLGEIQTADSSAPVIAVADGLQVWADSGLVRQLFDNLIGNAVKYVAPGVRPTIEITGLEVQEWLEIRVADNGIGIPEDQREEVFESFYRAHGEGFGGTGLGLAICRRIVDRHGGSIRVDPGPRGVGSVFVFRLPRLANAGQPLIDPARPAERV